MAPRRKAEGKQATAANLGFEAKLWQMADGLRNNMDAAEYKHVVLGLIFLKYISDAFEAKHAELETQRKKGADPEDPDEYKAASIFWVPKEARWSHLKAKAPQPTIGKLVDDAMSAIERDNPSLKTVLPKDFGRVGLDKVRLGQIINLVSDIDMRQPSSRPDSHPSPSSSPPGRGRGEGAKLGRGVQGEGGIEELRPSPSGRRARDEGSVEALDRLFPDSFEDSELGEIPKGWEVADVGALADVVSGKRPPVRFSEAIDDARVPLWGGNGPMAFVTAPLFQRPILLTGRVGTLGSVFRITSPCWPSDNTLVVLARDEAAYEFLYFQLRQVDFSSLNRGSTQPLVTQTDLKAQRFVIPEGSLLKQFHKVIDNLFSRVDALQNESRALAALRDTLLPKLISGELHIKATNNQLQSA